MIRHPSTWKAYLFIKRNRSRKKRKIYQMALGVMIDKTTAVYLVLVGGYAISSLFIFGDFINALTDEFHFLESQASIRFWLVLSMLPLTYILKSFKDPGIVYTTSEYQMGMLPYSPRKIWLLCALEKWIKQFILYVFLGSLIVWVTPISSTIVFAYTTSFLLISIIMTIPQWKLFQSRITTKVGWISIGLAINVIGMMAQAWVVTGLGLFALIIVTNIRLIGSIFSGVQWGRVTEISDYNTWNMGLIEKASETKFERQKKYSVFQNLATRKKPFPYTEKAIHSRLWQLFIGKNITHLFYLIGILLAMLTVLRFFENQLALYIGIVIALYTYSSTAANFFRIRFHADILEVLPWNLKGYKKTFYKWVWIGGLPIAIPILFHFIFNMTIWAPLQLILLYSTFLYFYETKVDKAITILEKKAILFQMREILGYVFLLIFITSSQVPAVALSFIIVLWLIWRDNLDHQAVEDNKGNY